ncbi:hypothetical protein [Nonomuraea zeae]|uniref:Uncharacterized protein n=1 Tax=Nonomuraea zeae TaxID=1642303 RepID=A0A5S4FZG7_9ACTN|nr:hypothetical protein [Nonomuraea zeae]TMR26185.1 hypothetical protein ETD85_43275 [Nonomuraea zeae]
MGQGIAGASSGGALAPTGVGVVSGEKPVLGCGWRRNCDACGNRWCGNRWWGHRSWGHRSWGHRSWGHHHHHRFTHHNVDDGRHPEEPVVQPAPERPPVKEPHRPPIKEHKPPRKEHKPPHHDDWPPIDDWSPGDDRLPFNN